MNYTTVAILFVGVVVAFGWLLMAHLWKPWLIKWWPIAIAIITVSALPMLWTPYTAWRDRGDVARAQAAYEGWFAGANPGMSIPALTTLQHPDTWFYVYTVDGKANSVLRVNQQWLVLSTPAATPTP